MSVHFIVPDHGIRKIKDAISRNLLGALEAAKVGIASGTYEVIVTHGLKMSGMPAFAPRLGDRDRWAIVAFVRYLGLLSPRQYQNLVTGGDANADSVDWSASADGGFDKLKSGNPARGRDWLFRYGCRSCHSIPGMAAGRVGPPLIAFAERQYIAGLFVNVPENVMDWIMDPKKYKPDTAMPKLGVKPNDAVDIAAFLYTLGDPRRVNALKRTINGAR